MSETYPCPECSAPLPADAFVCRGCVSKVREQLLNIAFMLPIADAKRARVGSNWSGGASGGASANKPIPFDPRISEAINPLVNVLTTTARMFEDQKGETCPATTPAALTLWVRERVQWASQQDWAPHLVREVREANDRIMRAFDLPPERYAIGQCKAEHGDGQVCTEHLSAPAREGFHECPRCHVQHDVRQRRSQLLEQAGGLHVTTHEAAKLLRIDGMDVDARTVRAVVRVVGINSPGHRDVRDIKGRSRRVPVYVLGALREAMTTLAHDPEKQREVKRARRLTS